MNTLFLSDYYLPHVGGSRVYYHSLLKNLVAQFPDSVTVLTKKVPGWKQFDGSESNASLRIVRHFKPFPNWKVYQYPRTAPPLAAALGYALSHPVNVVQVGDLFPQGMIGLALKRLLKLPYIVFAHGDEIAQTDSLRYLPMLRDRIYRSADAMVAANEFTRQRLIRIGIPEARIHKVTPGVDQERFRPQPRNEALVREFDLADKTVFLTAGRLVPRKNVKAVIQAVGRLIHEHPDLRYLIAGDGPDRPSLEHLVEESGLTKVVRFVGEVSNQSLADFYNLCDVFVLANRTMDGGDIETFGMVFIEANAAGKPVVGGRSGGTAEAVQHGVTGFLVNPDDVGELAASLALLIKNKELRRKLGLAGLHRAITEFNWKTRARCLHDLNAAVVEASRGRRVPVSNNSSVPKHKNVA